MRVADFNFDLPEALIARYPLALRSSCRLLSVHGETGALSHGIFTDLLQKIDAGDLLVFNDTKVIPARLFGQKASGGKIEILIERILDNHCALAHIKASKAPKVGAELYVGDTLSDKATVIARHDALFELQFDSDVLPLLEKIGHIPLPPYIERADEELDRDFYQTVYGVNPGAVAAPTAGLHFDDAMLTALKAKGVEFAFVTLHVGAGTFQPVRVDDIHDHKMHAEYVDVSIETAQAVMACKARGKRVIAVGTTSVRSLESAATATGVIQPFQSDTRIFIYPGYSFKIVDALVTNFHLPESTLIMLVCAFAGYNTVMNAYQEAIDKAYRFFSYGDAMFVTKNPNAMNEQP